jgi:hypothetical protein
MLFDLTVDGSVDVRKTIDLVTAEEEAEKLDRLIKEIRAKNQAIRKGKVGREGRIPSKKQPGP